MRFPEIIGVKKFKKKAKPKVDKRINDRAVAIIDTFGEGKASGSHITTCTKEQCLFPACYCS